MFCPSHVYRAGSASPVNAGLVRTILATGLAVVAPEPQADSTSSVDTSVAPNTAFFGRRIGFSRCRAAMCIY